MSKDQEQAINEVITASDNIRLLTSLVPIITKAAQNLADCLLKGGKILVCGNGGSAADACHLAAELVGRLCRERPGLAAIALNTDPAVATSLANDYGFNDSLARQVRALGNRGDYLVAISTSGRSGNIISAAQTAIELGLDVVTLIGSNRCQLGEITDATVIAAPGSSTQRIQEAHSVIIHILCQLIEDILYPTS